MFQQFVSCLLLISTESVRLRMINNTPNQFWIAFMGIESEHLENGGIILQQHESRYLYLPSNWSGKIWPRSHCNANEEICLTGDCGLFKCNGKFGAQPMSVIDLTLNGHAGLDYYGVSLMDGYNIAIKIVPIRGEGECKTSTCAFDLDDCPRALRIKSAQDVLGCLPACYVYARPCCRDKYVILENCAAYDWPVDSLPFFKHKCPNASGYTLDDNNGNFTCKAKDYDIFFGQKPSHKDVVLI